MSINWEKTNYKPYWYNEGVSFPDKHINDIIASNPNYKWIPISNPAIDWAQPDLNLTFDSTNKNHPDYLRCYDTVSGEFFYFYFSSISQVNSIKNNEFHYQYIYTLDKYMTYWYNFLHSIKESNPNVKHIKKFSNRCEWELDPETQKVKTITFDFIKNKEFGDTLDPINRQMVRKYLYGTTPTKLWNDNYKDITIPESVEFTNFTDSTKKYKVSFGHFNIPDEHNRFFYLVAKSSCKQIGKVSEDLKWNGKASNTKIIIPLFKEYAPAIFNALLNFNPTIEQECVINALSDGNFIGLYEAEAPYSLFYGASVKDPTNIKLLYGENFLTSENKISIPFFEVPINYAPKWTIVNYESYNIGLDGRLKYIINHITDLNPKTEPYLLNPKYYQERYSLDSGKFISSDMSLIKYTLENNPDSDTFDTSYSGLNLSAYFLFDSELATIYDYGDFNNQLNPLWNNNNSNIRTTLDLPNGTYGSASANFYASNPNTLTTGIANRKAEEATSWINQGFNAISGIANIASGYGASFLNYGKYANEIGNIQRYNTGVKGMSGILGGIQGLFNNGINQMYANRELSAKINNIGSSPSTTLTNPYAISAVPNKVEDTSNFLFNTYSNELHPWEADNVFMEVMSSGYPYTKITHINDYDNRLYMNVLQIDTTYNTDTLLNLLVNNESPIIFKNLNYYYEFLGWLSNLHRFYKTDWLINCIDYKSSDFIKNIEKDLPEFPTIKENINKYITNTNINYSQKWDYLDQLKALNPTAPEDIWENIEAIGEDNKTFIISSIEGSTKYYGSIVTLTICLPNKIKILENKELDIVPNNELDSYDSFKGIYSPLINNSWQENNSVPNVDWDFGLITRDYKNTNIRTVLDDIYPGITFETLKKYYQVINVAFSGVFKNSNPGDKNPPDNIQSITTSKAFISEDFSGISTISLWDKFKELNAYLHFWIQPIMSSSWVRNIYYPDIERALTQAGLPTTIDTTLNIKLNTDLTLNLETTTTPLRLPNIIRVTGTPSSPYQFFVGSCLRPTINYIELESNGNN